MIKQIILFKIIKDMPINISQALLASLIYECPPVVSFKAAVSDAKCGVVDTLQRVEIGSDKRWRHTTDHGHVHGLVNCMTSRPPTNLPLADLCLTI